VKAYPNKPWNWYGLSNNPNITFDIVKAYPDKPWDLSYNKFSYEKIHFIN